MSKTAYTLQKFLSNPNDFKQVNLSGAGLGGCDCVKLANVLKTNKTVNQLLLN